MSDPACQYRWPERRRARISAAAHDPLLSERAPSSAGKRLSPRRRSATSLLVAFTSCSVVLAACGDAEPSLSDTERAPDSTIPTDSTMSTEISSTPSESTTTISPSASTGSTTTTVAATPVSTVPSPAAEGGACPDGVLPAVGAVELDTGDVRWVVCSPTETYRSMIGATDDVVLVRESHQLGGHVIALDPDDGTELWRWQSPAAQRPPGSFTGSGTVVLLTGDHDDAELIGVDTLTGAERWRVPEHLTVLGSTDDVVAVERFSDAMGSEPIRGIDRETGTALWVADVAKLDTSGVYGAVGTSAIFRQLLIVPTGSTGSAVEAGTDLGATAIDLETGTVEWTSSDLGTPLGAGELVIGGGPLQGPEAMLHGVDPLTGRGAWSARGRTAYGGYIAVGDGVVVANGDVGLVAYEETTGIETWRAVDGFDPHAVADGKVVSLWEAALEARSTADGVVVWHLTEPFGSPFMNNLTTNSSTVFVAVNSLPWTD